jgi:DNA mismatch repair protein MutL
LLVDLPPTDVDVNVHPQKAEVRFSASSELFSAIVGLLRGSLASAPWARAVTSSDGVTPYTADLWTSRFRPGGVADAPAPPNTLFSDERTANATPEGEPDPWGLTAAASAHEALVMDPRETSHAAEGADGLFGAPGTFGSLRYVAQLRRMFLVCEGDTGMVLLDQHAAAERVTYDRLRKAFGSRTVAMQPLLVPEHVEANANEIALAEERANDLAAIGLELTPVGPTTLAVRAVPALLSRADPRRLARDVLSELAREGNDFSRAIDLVLATMACHGSVRAGDDLADEEARALLRALDAVDFAGHCPHGRPVVWSVRWSELERRLGR